MEIDLILTGKTDMQEIGSIVQMYSKRINRYVKFSITVLPDIKGSKKLPVRDQQSAEGKAVLSQTNATDHVVLLDEHGSEYRSVEFAAWLEKKMSYGGMKRICFIVGGPYGFSQEVHARANELIALSKMTFSHQIIRAIFTEQLYRAFSIINNEPYHNE